MSIRIRKDRSVKKQKIFCEICSAVLKNSLDFNSSDAYGCCEMCRLRWVESRVESYLSGWRPKKEDVDDEIDKRNSLPLNFTI